MNSSLMLICAVLLWGLVALSSADVLKVKNHVLVGFAAEVLTKADLDDCIRVCENMAITQNDNKSPCRSGMFFVTKKGNCILNSVTKEDHPDLFVEHLNEEVTYFQIIPDIN